MGQCVSVLDISDKRDTTDLILMKLQGVVHHTALAFSKLLCLAQGGGSNYLANILITSHISHTAGGIKWNLEHISNYPCSTNLSLGPTVCNILDFPLFLSWFKTTWPPRLFLCFFFQISLLITAGVSASLVPSFKYRTCKNENSRKQCK